jgi:hypothetical protein
MCLSATRPIAKGEEITLRYINLRDPRTIRRGRLLDMYYFHCECEYCNLPSEAVAVSDAARLELKRWPKSYCISHEWCPNLSLPDNYLVDGHKRCIELHEREGIIDTIYAGHIEELAVVYAMLGDEQNFRLWAQKAVEQSKIRQMPENTMFWKEWLSYPQQNSWGWRIVEKSRKQ